MDYVPTDKDVSHSQAEVCLNLWYFVDDSGIVIRLAGKAYALRGTDDQKLAALHQVAGTDHLTAAMAKVPSRLVIKTDSGVLPGAIPVADIHHIHSAVFGPLIDQIEKELPTCIRSLAETYEHFIMKIPQDPLCVTTAVYERSDGELVARIGQPS